MSFRYNVGPKAENNHCNDIFSGSGLESLILQTFFTCH